VNLTAVWVGVGVGPLLVGGGLIALAGENSALLSDVGALTALTGLGVALLAILRLIFQSAKRTRFT
jgi:hypothetical protein